MMDEGTWQHKNTNNDKQRKKNMYDMKLPPCILEVQGGLGWGAFTRAHHEAVNSLLTRSATCRCGLLIVGTVGML